jgi:hypothetical protein
MTIPEIILKHGLPIRIQDTREGLTHRKCTVLEDLGGMFLVRFADDGGDKPQGLTTDSIFDFYSVVKEM